MGGSSERRGLGKETERGRGDMRTDEGFRGVTEMVIRCRECED